MGKRIFWIINRFASFGGGKHESRSIALRQIHPLRLLAERADFELKIVDENQFSPAQTQSLDVVFFCRHSSARSLEIHQTLAEQHIFTVYDVDDLVGRYPGYFNLHEEQQVTTDVISSHLTLASIITTENHRLANSIKGLVQDKSKITIIPNTFDFHLFDCKKIDSLISNKIIFTNAAGIKFDAFKDDFFSAVNEYCDITNSVVHVFSDSPHSEFSFTSMVHRGATSWDEHKRILATEHFDLALVPLGAHEDPHLQDFNSCKSIIKFIEYGAAKIPGIFTCTPPYSDHLQHKVDSMLVPNNGKEWLHAMMEVFASEYLRESIVDTAYRKIKSKYHIDISASLYDRITSYSQAIRSPRLES